MQKIDWPTIITAIVAVYGAILSTYNLLIKRKDNKRQVDVTLKWGLVGVMDKPNAMFLLNAANPGKRTVTLEGCHIEFPNMKQLVMPYPLGTIKFPHDLEEGKNCTVWFPISEVVEALVSQGYTGNVSICAVFRDALGGKYKSSLFEGNVSEWAKVR